MAANWYVHNRRTGAEHGGRRATLKDAKAEALHVATVLGKGSVATVVDAKGQVWRARRSDAGSVIWDKRASLGGEHG